MAFEEDDIFLRIKLDAGSAEEDIKILTAEIEKLKARNKELAADNKELAKSEDDVTAAMTKNSVEMAENTQKIQKMNAARRTEIKETQNQKNSLNALRQELIRMKIQRDTNFEVGSQQFVKATQDIANLNQRS